MFVVIEVALIISVVFFALSQVIVPLIRGRQTFPFFRKQADLEKELAATRQEKYEKSLKSTINSEKKGK